MPGSREDGSANPVFRRGVLIADHDVRVLSEALAAGAPEDSVETIISPLDGLDQGVAAARARGFTDFAVVWSRPEVALPSFGPALRGTPVDPEQLKREVDAFCMRLVEKCDGFGLGVFPLWTLPSFYRGLGIFESRAVGARFGLLDVTYRLVENMRLYTANWHVLDANRWNSEVPRSRWGSVHAADLQRAAAQEMRSLFSSLAGGGPSLVVVGMDDTLWGGNVGQLGSERVRLGAADPAGEAFVDVQKFIARLPNRGFRLAAMSEAPEQAVAALLSSHPESVVRQADFSTMAFDVANPSEGLRRIADREGLPLERIVYLDAVSARREAVRLSHPNVRVPELPKDPFLLPSALTRLELFDRPLSGAFAERMREAAAEEAERGKLLNSVGGSVEEWLKNLQVRVELAPLDAHSLVLTHKMMKRVNGMTLNGQTPSDDALAAWIGRPQCDFWVATVADRFGTLGVTAVINLEMDGPVGRVRDFVVDCRAMGRKVEETLLHVVIERARERGARQVVVEFEATPKNDIFVDYLRATALVDEGTRFVWDAQAPFAKPEFVEVVHKAAGRESP